MKQRPTIEQCESCDNKHKGEIAKFQESIETLHYAVNKMMKEYARLHIEETALIEIEDICLKEDINDALEKVRDICQKIKKQIEELK